MGHDLVEFSGSARLSRHNSPRDNDDNDRWNNFVAQLNTLAEEHSDIGLVLFAPPICDYPDYRE